MHRLTALYLSLAGIAIAAWFLISAAIGPSAFERFQNFAASWFGHFVLFSLTWSFFQHLFSGIRHLIMDTGKGFGLADSHRLAVWTFLGSLVATVGFWTAITLKHWSLL